MTRAEYPSSPSQEILDRQAWAGPTLANGVLTPELADFCQSGISVVLGSRDSYGQPLVARGLACRINAEGLVRIIYREQPNKALQQAIETGAPIAATFTKPFSHRSIQLKASGARTARVVVQDGAAAFAQTRAFHQELVDVGHTEQFASGYTRFEPHELAALEFLPEAAFVQTPGLNAGSVLTP
ncbi:hypothetical protein [Roseibium sp. M-1]